MYPFRKYTKKGIISEYMDGWVDGGLTEKRLTFDLVVCLWNR